MPKVVVVNNPNPEFEARLESIMREHSLNVELAFARLKDEAFRAMLGAENLGRAMREFEVADEDGKVIDASYSYDDIADASKRLPAGSVTGRLAGYAPECQDLIPRKSKITWPTAEELSGKTGAGLTLADVDYSAVEERLLAHYPNINLGEPYAAPVYTEQKEPDMDIPDRVCINPSDLHFWPQYKSLGVKIDGEDRPGDVHEFCVSEGWAMVRERGPNGKFVIDPEGKGYALVKLEGKIEPYFRRPPETAPVPTQSDYDRIKAAEAKRARKAMKRSGTNGA